MNHYIEQSTDDIEQLFAYVANDHWEYRLIQLTPGPLDSRYAAVFLPEMTISWYRYRPAIHVQESHGLPAVFFTFVIDAAEAPRWFGHEFQADMALLYLPGQEQDYVIPQRLFSVGVMIQESLVQRMGWQFSGPACQRVGRDSLMELKEACQQLTRRLQQRPATESELQIAQERLAMHLDKTLAPWMKSGNGNTPGLDKPTRSCRTVRQALDLLDEWPADRNLDIGELARAIPTHRRTLYRAFRDYLGIGPYEYYLISRLHVFRRALEQAPTHHGVITRAALQAGFAHMGRFTEQYRKHFVERPNDTLRRWKLAVTG